MFRYAEDIVKVIDSERKRLGIAREKLLITQLGIGENNLNLLAKAGEKKFVVRICLRPDLERNFEREFKNLSKIPEHIGPRPLFFDASKKNVPRPFAILSYVEGQQVHRWTVEHLYCHARKLAELHRKSYPYREGNKKRLSIVEEFKKKIKKEKSLLTDPRCNSILPKLFLYLKNNDQYFLELKRFHLIHGDLCVDNILFYKDQVRYIDWEWMRIEDNAEDLSRLYYENFTLRPWTIRLQEEDIDAFLDEYLSLQPEKTLKKRVKVWNTYFHFTDLIFCLWKIRHFDREEKNRPKEFYQRAVQLLLHSLEKKVGE